MNNPATLPAAAEPQAADLLAAVREALDAVRSHAGGEISRLVHIRNFRSETYRLVSDMAVYLYLDGDQWIAKSFDTGQYGYGVSPEDAIEHLCTVIEDYYEILQEDRGNLSRQLEGYLHYLDIVLTRVP